MPRKHAAIAQRAAKVPPAKLAAIPPPNVANAWVQVARGISELEVRQQLDRLEWIILNGAKGQVVLSEEERRIAEKAIQLAFNWLNNIPVLDRYSATLEICRNPKPALAALGLEGRADVEARLVRTRLLGLPDDDARPKKGRPKERDTEQLVWAYYALIGQVEPQDAEEEAQAWAWRNNAQVDGYDESPLRPIDALAYLAKVWGGRQPGEAVARREEALRKRLYNAGVRPLPGYRDV